MATAQDYALNLSKICYCGLKSSKNICKNTMPLLAYISVRNVRKKGAWLPYIFFQIYNKQEGTGKFIYNPSI